MPLFRPRYLARHVTDLPASFFTEKGVRAIILDLDNTLTTHGNPVPAQGVPEWIAAMKAAGLRLAILSNNYRSRVEPFARLLGLEFVSFAGKPLPFGAVRACKRWGLRRKETVLIGDQIFTDMICGNLAGIPTVLVEPYQLETTRPFKLRRRLERPLIRRYKKKEGRQ